MDKEKDRENLMQGCLEILEKLKDKTKEEKEEAVREFSQAYGRATQWAINVITGAINNSGKHGTALFFAEALGMIKAALESELKEDEKEAREFFNSRTTRRELRFVMSEESEMSTEEANEALSGLEGDKLVAKLEELTESGVFKHSTVTRKAEEDKQGDEQADEALKGLPDDIKDVIMIELFNKVNDYIDEAIDLLPEEETRRMDVVALVAALDLATPLIAAEYPGVLPAAAELRALYFDSGKYSRRVREATADASVQEDLEKAIGVFRRYHE